MAPELMHLVPFGNTMLTIMSSNCEDDQVSIAGFVNERLGFPNVVCRRGRHLGGLIADD